MANYSRPLSQYLKAELRVLVECRQCGHIAIFSAVGLSKRWGTEIDPAFLPFRCQAPRPSDGRRCGSRNIRIGPLWPHKVVELGLPGEAPRVGPGD